MTKLFGTNGIRGVVNEEMTIDLASHIGLAWGTYLYQQYEKPKVAIGTDARLSNIMLKQSVSSGLLATGCKVTDVGLLPTPAIQYTVKTKDFDSGVVITASHNPPQFNGIKGIDADGTEFSKKTEETIEDIYFRKTFSLKHWNQIHRVCVADNAAQDYKNAIIGQVDSNTIKQKKLHVVLDCGNGAGGIVTPDLLSQFGCKLLCLNCEPDGHFPGHPSEPTPENLQQLMNTVKKTDADFGVAQDGDADRAIFVDEQGRYVWGDQTLTLMADYITKENNGGTVVTPVTSSRSVEEVVTKNNGKVVRTKVGSPIVAREMMKQNAVFGGEENGGLIFPKMQFCRDSAMTIAKIIEIICSENKSFSSLLDKLPRYELLKTKINCPNHLKQKVLEEIKNQVSKESQIMNIDTTDGLKLYYNSGWVLMRPSGTEPIFRVYAEAKTSGEAKKLADSSTKEVKTIIENFEEKKQ